MLRRVHSRRLVRLLGAAAIAVAIAGPACAAGSGMPWEGPLQQVVDSLTGPVARAAGVVAIVIAGMGIMFTEGGSGVRKLAFVGLGVAIMFAAATWGLQFFGFAGGAVL
jgi:type IV secretory pathway VirB2 component (pilin)